MKRLRKILLIVLILLIYFCLVREIYNEKYTDIGEFSDIMCMSENGLSYYVDDSNTYFKIYSVNDKFHFSEICTIRPKQGNMRRTVKAINVQNNVLYILSRYIDNSKSVFAKWQVSAYDMSSGKEQTLLETKEDVTFTELSIHDGKLYLPGYRQDESGSPAIVELYSASLNAEPKLVKTVERSFDGAEFVMKALCNKGKLYVLSSGGHIYLCDNSNKLTNIDGTGDKFFTYASGAGGALMAYDQNSNSIYYDSERIKKEAVVKFQDKYSLKCGFALARDKMSYVLTDSKGDASYQVFEGGELRNITKDINSSMKEIRGNVTLNIIISIIYFLFFLIIFVFVKIYMSSRRLAVRLSMISVGMALILAIVLTCVFYVQNTRLVVNEKNNLSIINHEKQKELVAGMEENTVNIENYGESVTYFIFRVLLEHYEVQDSTMMNRINNYIIYYDDDQAYVLAEGSKKYVPGTEASNCFKPYEMEYILDCIENESDVATNRIDYYGGRGSSITVSPITDAASAKLFLVTSASTDNLMSSNMNTLTTLLKATMIITAIAIVIIVLVIFIAMRPIRNLSNTMTRVAAGDFEYDKIEIKNHEIGVMWIALRKMCNALKNRNYLNATVLSSYYRFVPRKLETLLNKEKIMDVHVGDSKYIDGTIAMVSVSDDQDISVVGDTKEYMNSVNESFRIIDTYVRDYDGVMLSNDYKISSVKIMYPDSVEKAVEAGIESTIELASKFESPMTIIHSAPYLYGIAGTEEMAFPFISSADIEVLSDFYEDFRRTGTKLVVTDATYKKLNSSHSMRYIGYITDSTEKYSYKVYEVLDVYDETERKRILKLDEKFQQAIQMFYKNDFYLARNIFSSIIKDNIKDGIARWYLFACEQLLNCGDYEMIKHSLFGVDIQNKKINALKISGWK